MCRAKWNREQDVYLVPYVQKVCAKQIGALRQAVQRADPKVRVRMHDASWRVLFTVHEITCMQPSMTVSSLHAGAFPHGLAGGAAAAATCGSLRARTAPCCCKKLLEETVLQCVAVP